MIAEKIKSQMRRGLLEYYILQILSYKEVYASDLIEELQKAKLLSVEGIIYPLLMKFKQEGLVIYEWNNTSERLPKKHYQLTEEGKVVTTSLMKEFNSFIKLSKDMSKNN